MRVYLAGPDVFLPDPRARAALLKSVCAKHGLTGIFPLDPLADEPASWSSLPEWRQIALRNEAHIRSSDALIANLTPFRGLSADPGTVFELGFMRALGRPVFAWSNDPRSFAERALAGLGLGTEARGRPDAMARDRDGLAIESFGCTENLMIDGALAASGGTLVLAADRDAPWSLEAFRRCVQSLADCAGRAINASGHG